LGNCPAAGEQLPQVPGSWDQRPALGRRTPGRPPPTWQRPRPSAARRLHWPRRPPAPRPGRRRDWL